jgi:multidrug efflux system outer membrane protein
VRRLAPSLLAVSLLASGCSLDPAYVRPTAAVPTAWPKGEAYPEATEATPSLISYRDIFRDPKLQAIIDRALANNQDIRLALANVAAARAQYRVQRADLFPQVGAGAGVTTGETRSSNTGLVANPGRRTTYSADVDLTSFELDLFGRLRSLSRAAMQTYLASEANVRAVRLTLVAETASAYLTLAADRSLIAIAVETEASAQRSVELTSARLKGGVAPRTDLRQAETVLRQAQADHANLITQVAQDRNALELLVGASVPDAELPPSIESIDGMLGELPAGLDSRILLKRPDVVEAEAQLKAADARIGAARAAFFPTIGLTAAAGFVSPALSSLFSGDRFNWSVSPSASVPIFQGGALKGNLALARAQRDQSLAQYQQAIQTAFREVADALARRGTIAREYEAQAALEEAAADSYRLEDARYREGVDPFLSSLDAQRTLYGARRSLASTRLTRADNLVALYRTLGGDMVIDQLPPATLTSVAGGSARPAS